MPFPVSKLLMDALERAAARGRHDLRRRLWILATVASLAPSLGLLGTVIGMIHGFPGCGAPKSYCMAAIVAAQSEALVATGAGLLVALPAYWFYHYLEQQCSGLCLEIDLLVLCWPRRPPARIPC